VQEKSVIFGHPHFFLTPFLSLAEMVQAIGRAVAQAVNRRLPTAAVRVRAQVSSYGICGRKIGTGVSFLPVLLFPLSILIPPTAPRSSSIIRGWYNRPVNGRSTKWTQSHPITRKLKKKVVQTSSVYTVILRMISIEF
jgi:hypothetical protein